MKREQLVLKSSELPLPLVIIGDKGEREVYLIKAAGRKFGASLSKPEKQVTTYNH